MKSAFTQESPKVREFGARVLRQIALERAHFLQQLGQRIAERRAELRLTQEDVASRAGVTLRGYSRWERGEALPYPRNIEQLAEALETTPGYLLGDDQAQNGRPEAITEQLDRIENRLEEIYELLSPDAALADQAHEEQIERALADVPEPPAQSEEAPPGRAAGGSRQASG